MSLKNKKVSVSKIINILNRRRMSCKGWVGFGLILYSQEIQIWSLVAWSESKPLSNTAFTHENTIKLPLYWNGSYLQYARTSEAPTAEGRDWRAVLLRWEALQSAETHCWEGAAYGMKTGVTEQVLLNIYCCIVIIIVSVCDLDVMVIFKFTTLWFYELKRVCVMVM